MLKGKKIKYHSMKTCAFPTHPTVRTQCRYYKSLSNALLDKFRCAKYKKCKNVAYQKQDHAQCCKVPVVLQPA